MITKDVHFCSQFESERYFKDDWQRRVATDKLIEIVDLLKTVSLSPGADWASVKSYTEAIHEISFLIFKGAPAGYQHSSRVSGYRHQDRESRQEVLERHIGDVTREMIELWYDPKREWFDCEHALFSIVGMAAVAFKATGRAHAKTIALESSRNAIPLHFLLDILAKLRLCREGCYRGTNCSRNRPKIVSLR